jgi:hypothetical protein
MMNAVFWDVTSCGSCRNRRFGGDCFLHLQGRKNQQARNNVSSSLLLSANVVPRQQALPTLKMEAIRCTETLVLTRSTRRHILENAILRR